MKRIAIDLNPGETGESLDPDMWNGFDGAKAVQNMRNTVPENQVPLLRSDMSLRALAQIADPLHLSESLRARLAEQSPDFLCPLTDPSQTS